MSHYDRPLGPSKDRPLNTSLPPPPPAPKRDARAHLRATILPNALPTALPDFAQALEDDVLRPAKVEDFYDLTKAREQAELTAAQKKTLFRQAFFEEQVSLEELTPYRIRVAWRIVREFLRLRGTHEDQSLGQLQPNAQVTDPWMHLRTNAPRRFCTGPASSVLPILDVADRLDPPGLPLLPPLVPVNAPHDYKPGVSDHDPRLHLYTNALNTVATYLGIPDGTKAERRLGKYGLLGMNNPLTIRLTFPSRLELVQYERILVQETLDLLTKVGRRSAEESLHARHGLMDDEVMLLFRLASSRARAITRSDADEDKAHMILMLEDYIRRCREVSSIKMEMQALKQLSIVQSLAKIAPEDINADFAALVAKFESEPRPPLQLPAE